MTTTSISAPINDALAELAIKDREKGIRTRFQAEKNRAQQFSYDFESLVFDFSKTHISEELLDLYAKFATDIEFENKRLALFSGEKINSTEQRAVLHTLLRDPSNHGVPLIEPELGKEATDSLNQFRQSYQAIRRQLDAREQPIRDIIHIGIGGSALGTQLLFEALKPVAEPVNIHFIGNIDGHQLDAVLAGCDPQTTLVIGVSKTFGTAETLQNIRSVGDWFSAGGGENFLNQVYAVTAEPDNALAFGVPAENTVVFPQWVGGRYSVWSAVSLSAALVLGFDRFEQFLLGARLMDEHFLQTAPSNNLSFIAAAMDHYYANYFAAASRAIFAYDYRLRSLVDYLQQLETESNGKDRQINGAPADQRTAPVIWGGVGTNVQHSVFQMLHQGTNLIPAEFILVAQPDHELTEHHDELLANGLAQTAALLAGQTLEEVKSREAGSELTQAAKIFSGDRPSMTLLLERLTPAALGSILAFYEQRTFCYGILCNINSFDQMGVELGKRLAKQLRPRLQKNSNIESEANESQVSKFDSSTEALIERVNRATQKG